MPDKIIKHDITECKCCKNQLPTAGEVKSRQLFDIPPIAIEVTEHQIVTKICSHCGTSNKFNFPKGLVQQAQYGNNIKSLEVYLQNYHMLPFVGTVLPFSIINLIRTIIIKFMVESILIVIQNLTRF